MPVIRGFGWNYFLFQVSGPDKHLIDQVISDKPVILTSFDGHSICVNSKALEFAGIGPVTPDPREVRLTGNAAITSGMGSGVSASRDSSDDSFSCSLKCHHANGELYSVTFKRDSVTLSSYESDAIRISLESWADTVAILA